MAFISSELFPSISPQPSANPQASADSEPSPSPKPSPDSEPSTNPEASTTDKRDILSKELPKIFDLEDFTSETTPHLYWEELLRPLFKITPSHLQGPFAHDIKGKVLQIGGERGIWAQALKVHANVRSVQRLRDEVENLHQPQLYSTEEARKTFDAQLKIFTIQHAFSFDFIVINAMHIPADRLARYSAICSSLLVAGGKLYVHGVHGDLFKAFPQLTTDIPDGVYLHKPFTSVKSLVGSGLVLQSVKELGFETYKILYHKAGDGEDPNLPLFKEYGFEGKIYTLLRFSKNAL